VSDLVKFKSCCDPPLMSAELFASTASAISEHSFLQQTDKMLQNACVKKYMAASIVAFHWARKLLFMTL